MKKLLKVTTVVSMSMMIFTSGVVFASPIKTSIKAILDKGTKFTLNGNSTELKDSNGNTVYPIKYKHNIYVPITSIGDMLKTPVIVNEKEDTVAIGQREDKSLIDFGMTIGNGTFSSIVKTTDKTHLTFGDVTFKKGIIYNVGSYITSRDLTVYLDKKYSTLSFSAISDNSNPMTLSVVNGDTNVEIASVQISKNGVSSLSDVPIGGISKLVLRPEYCDSAMKIVIGDPIVK